MTGHVLLYVQHLLGVGHAKRAAAIARGIRDAGQSVTVAFGGHPVPGADFADATMEYLPAIRAADATFSTLINADGAPVSDALWERRTHMLLDLHDRIQPTAILTEHFPFGRRKFKRELIPLFVHARKNPDVKIIGSVRDILITPSDDAKAQKMIELAKRWYDTILVHSDPTVLRLEETFPQAEQIANLLHYTGYIAEPRPTIVPPSDDGHAEIVVSAGGGAVGDVLFQTALATRRAGCEPDRTWRFLTGSNLNPETVETLKGDLPAGVIIEAARPDFPTLLKRAALSISQAGYNTIMDLVMARCPSIVVPFATGGETEQTVRANTFERAGCLTHLPEADLSPTRLATTINTVLAQQPASHAVMCDVDGIRKTGQAIAELNNGPAQQL